MYKAIALTLLISISEIASAAWTTNTAEVTKVYSHNGAHVIRTNHTQEICDDAGAFWWPADDPDAKDMFALALAALMSGKKISVVYDEESPSCSHGNSAIITHMRIDK